MKPGKKLVPASFAEVIDSLLDALQNYKDPVVSQREAEKPESEAGPSSMETDSPAMPAASGAPAASPAENGHAGPSGQPAPTEASAAEEVKAKANRKVHLTFMLMCSCSFYYPAHGYVALMHAKEALLLNLKHVPWQWQRILHFACWAGFPLHAMNRKGSNWKGLWAVSHVTE